MKYKKGMKVRLISEIDDKGFVWSSIKHLIGKEVVISLVVDTNSYHHYFISLDGKELCVNATENMLEPVNEFQVPFYVDCPTQEIWDKVERRMFEMGYKWFGRQSHIKFEESSYIRADREKTMFWAEINYTHKDKGQYIPYQQFLGEEVKEAKERAFRVGDKVRITKSCEFEIGSIGTIVQAEPPEYHGAMNCVIEVGFDRYWVVNGFYELITPVKENEATRTHSINEDDTLTTEDIVRFGEELMKSFGNGVNLPMPEPVNPFYKLSKSLMSGFKKATAFIKRLGEPLSTYYSLGWVELENDEFTTTGEGKQALADFTLIGGAKTFEEYAKKELSRRKKASKVKDEDED